MTVFVRVKAITGKKPIIDSIPVEIDEGIKTSNELVACIVKKNVKAFNERKADKPIFAYLTDDETQMGIKTGKIGFGDKKNENIKDVEQAVENALTCYSDGIFRMFVGEKEALYDQPVDIREKDQLTFIRLTMLAGRLW